VKGQGEMVYHGGKDVIDNVDNVDFKRGLYTLKRTADDIANQEKYLKYLTPEIFTSNIVLFSV
jgi:hypothetical protein